MENFFHGFIQLLKHEWKFERMRIVSNACTMEAFPQFCKSPKTYSFSDSIETWPECEKMKGKSLAYLIIKMFLHVSGY